MAPFPFFNWKAEWNNNNKRRGEEDLIVFRCRHHHHHHHQYTLIFQDPGMFDFKEVGPAPVRASLRFLNIGVDRMRLFSLFQHHLLHLVGNSQNK